MKKILYFSLLLAAIIIFSNLGFLANRAFATGYAYSRSLTIAHSQVPSDQSNFTVLVCANGTAPCTTSVPGLNQSGGGAHVTDPNGYDIVFSTVSDCSSGLLNWEMEKYVGSSGEMEAWVKIPSLSSSSDTTVYMCYGNSSISSFQGGSTGSAWDTNYKAVYHLANIGSITDSSGNQSAATNHSTTATTGQIDGAANFSSGSSQYIDLGSSIPSEGTITYETWVKFTTLSTYQLASFSDGIGSPTDGLGVFIEGNHVIAVTRNSDSTGKQSSGTVLASTWYHLVVEKTANQVNKIFLNGTDVSAADVTDFVGTNLAANFLGINENATSFPLNGAEDEVRISNVTRAPDWITSEYNNQSAPATFETFGGEVSGATSYTFTGPSSGNAGAASTNFTVTPTGGNYTGTITLTPSGSALGSLTATVLTFSNSSAAQTFTVTPTVAGTLTLTPSNNGGLTDPANLTYTVSAVVPNAPTGASATAGNASATVTFSTPGFNGGSTITGYTVTTLSNGGGASGTDSNAGSTSLSHVMTGLTNGDVYTFTVHATNTAGNSAESSATSGVTPNIPSATSYTFTGPSSGNAGAASTNFTVTPTGGNYTGTITLTPSGSALGSLTATVLTFSNSSAAQTFTVTPTVAGTLTLTPSNNGGLTDPANLTYTVSAVVPNAPTGASATAGNASATVTFSTPGFNGGSTITGYTVTTLSNGGGASGTDSNAGSTSLSHVMTGLTNGDVYTFTVHATNTAGNSAESSATSGVTPNIPSATSYTFTGPSSGNAGAASTNFTVTPTGGNYTGTITLTPSGSALGSLTATVLTFSNSSAAQTFTVTPTVAGTLTLTPSNNGGLTDPANLTYTVSAVVPNAPTGASATAGNASATVTFSTPGFNGGSTITGYTVTTLSNGGGASGTDSNAGSTSLSHVMTGLTNGDVYTFTVHATNTAGNSAESSATSGVTPTANTHTLSGTIKYYDNTQVLPNVTVTLEDGSGNPITSTTTDSNGTYSLTNVADGGNYIVVASKADATTTGESAADEIKIARQIVGLELFDTIYKNIAGDVNLDGILNSADEIKIARHLVGLDALLPSGAWKFYSSSVTPTTGNYLTTGISRTYTNLTSDASSQNFVGIKMGDTDRSW